MGGCYSKRSQCFAVCTVRTKTQMIDDGWPAGRNPDACPCDWFSAFFENKKGYSHRDVSYRRFVQFLWEATKFFMTFYLWMSPNPNPNPNPTCNTNPNPNGRLPTSL